MIYDQNIHAHSRDLLREVVRQATYKPGWKIGVTDYGTLVITVDTKDAYHPERDVRITHSYMVEPARDEWEALAFLRDCIHRTERHEADEWLRINGVAAFDPHSDLGPREHLARTLPT